MICYFAPREDWKVTDENGYAPSLRMRATKLDLRRTHIIEGTLAGMPQQAQTDRKYGIFFDQGDGQGQALLLTRDAVRFGDIKADGSNLKVLQTSSRDIDFGAEWEFRLVIGGDMMELYINDYLLNLKRVRYCRRIGFIIPAYANQTEES